MKEPRREEEGGLGGGGGGGAPGPVGTVQFVMAILGKWQCHSLALFDIPLAVPCTTVKTNPITLKES